MFKGRIERMAVKGFLWLFVVFLLSVAVFFAGATWEIRHKERTAWQEREYVRVQYEELTSRHIALSEKLSDLETERGLEEEFRKRFPVARDGEEVVVLVDATRAVEDTTIDPPQTFWDRIRGWFGF